MQRYFLKLAYNGAAYHGWQIQPNAVSVQEVLEQALSALLKASIAVVGCGRTDTGVHASVFFAHFETEIIFEPKSLVRKLNGFLRENIVIYDCFPVSDELHARFSAEYRIYRYYVSTCKDPFRTQLSYQIFKNIDFDKMNQAAKVLFDYIDFSAFSKSHTQTMTNNCKILRAEWVQSPNEHLWYFEIEADRFLRNMVRAIVGTLLEIGYGKLTVDAFREIIESKDRREAGVSVPAHALFLYDVGYPKEFLKDSSL
ncbi:MAG: tRNA pseudouridine(38-40) synthase TruA [Bacteroidales bacterium]|jgi:tRNA pseudouridine38-40 synthase|nr:tRNA pseudouridine(38-40) synthase TruA [Bacteroidales bacterium]